MPFDVHKPRILWVVVKHSNDGFYNLTSSNRIIFSFSSVVIVFFCFCSYGRNIRLLNSLEDWHKSDKIIRNAFSIFPPYTKCSNFMWLNGQSDADGLWHKHIRTAPHYVENSCSCDTNYHLNSSSYHQTCWTHAIKMISIFFFCWVRGWLWLLASPMLL